MLKNEITYEREWLSHDEKKKILKKTHSKCACCGKQLTLKTMTVEHIIPVSRGGRYLLKNMIALCEDCNIRKGNMLYRPEGFYLYTINEPCFVEMQEVFSEWFDTVYQDFKIELFPLISPRYYTLFSPMAIAKGKMPIISKQLMLSWCFIGNDKMAEIEIITGEDVPRLRKQTNLLHYAHTVTEKSKPINSNHSVAVYAMTQLSTSKYLALMSVLVDRENKAVSIYLPWTDMSKTYEPWAVYYFAICLLQSLDIYAHVDITSINIFTKNINQLDYFKYKSQESILGIGCSRPYTVDITNIPNAQNAITIIRRWDETNYDCKMIALKCKDEHYIKRTKILQDDFNARKQIAEERYKKAHFIEENEHEQSATGNEDETDTVI